MICLRNQHFLYKNNYLNLNLTQNQPCKCKLRFTSLHVSIDKAEKADKEAQKISESFQKIYIGLCKENMLLGTMKQLLGSCIQELNTASAALSEHMKTKDKNADWKYYHMLADKRLNDLVLSTNIASQSIMMISYMYDRNSALSQRIESLKVNTLVLRRAGIEALRNAPDKDKMDRVCGIEDVISAAISNIIIR